MSDLVEFCEDNNISCETCVYFKNIMRASAVPIFSCDYMFAGGAYSGSYVTLGDKDIFACLRYESKEDD